MTGKRGERRQAQHSPRVSFTLATAKTSQIMKFPVKPWLPFQKRPSDVILQALSQLSFLRARRTATADTFSENEMRAHYLLPAETHRVLFTTEEWDKFVKLNSFRATRAKATIFALSLPTKLV